MYNDLTDRVNHLTEGYRVNTASDRRVDHTALRVNQTSIIALLIAAFIVDAPPLVAVVCAVMLIGTFVPEAALFKRLYLDLLKPRGWLRPDVQVDNPEPHQFAQAVGGSVLAVALLAFIGGLGVVGWGLVWLVVALAALNLLARVCVGCLMYYQLHRLGVRGFTHAPIAGGQS
jgi:hypothetical protein